jgi:hypothetical protein
MPIDTWWNGFTLGTGVGFALACLLIWLMDKWLERLRAKRQQPHVFPPCAKHYPIRYPEPITGQMVLVCDRCGDLVEE